MPDKTLVVLMIGILRFDFKGTNDIKSNPGLDLLPYSACNTSSSLLLSASNV